MTKTAVPNDLEIAPAYTVRCWKRLSLDPYQPNSEDWKKALEIFDARIRGRFLDPADVLIKYEASCSPKRFGFAILAIDCLVIETLQGFREGVIDHRNKGERLFTNFLKRWEAFEDCVPDENKREERAKLIYKDYRCALHHSGSTTDALRVGVSGPVFDFKNDCEVRINRTCFHEELNLEFGRYLDDLRNPTNAELRCNFMSKMNAICGIADVC